MGLTLSTFVADFASALKKVDASGIAHKNFQPGVGPLTEALTVKHALSALRSISPATYNTAETKRHPDLLIPGEWQLEFKVIRPFGDNGKEAEGWSQNALHPYAGHISSIGDCLNLLESDRQGRRGVIMYGFEHDPAKIPLEPCFSGFEILATELMGIRLLDRVQAEVRNLIHPIHRVLRICGWELLGSEPNTGKKSRLSLVR